MKPGEAHDVIIVGAGVAGLATSIRLAAKGYAVRVFEQNESPGGKLSEIYSKGYRFDYGPSLFTMPQYVEELYRLAGKDPAEFPYLRLERACEYFYEDGSRITAWADRQKFVEELSEKTGEDPQHIQKALKNSAFLYDTLGELFMHRSLHKWKTFVSKPAFKAYGRLHRLGFGRTMHQANQQQLKDPRLVQLFDRYATYNGSDPYQTPGTLNIIPHLEYGFGAFFPENGMYQITRSLEGLARDLGVTFSYQTDVNEIVVEENQVKGVKTSKGFFPARHVVSNMDITKTYSRLLPKVKTPQKLVSQPKSSSALIFYWGIGKSFPELDLHNIFFSKDYKKEFDHIWKHKTISSDPTVYINITSKYKPDDAPPGKENWFTMINVPHNDGQDWDALIDQARKNMIQKLSRMLGTDIGALVETEEVLDPRLIEANTFSAQGALYGNSSNNKYAAFLRHANFSRKISGLYFCGGSVHPGGGIPLCLSSARLVAEEFK